MTLETNPRAFTSGSALFRADWTDVLFIHFRVNREALRTVVPAELQIDTHDGQAYISLVAFTQRRLRPVVGGRLAALLAAPLAEHPFLNLRAYVRRGSDCGIFFLAEWIPNRLAVFVGPRTYGLPYRVGTLRHRCDLERGVFDARVTSRDGRLVASADFDPRSLAPAKLGTLDAFLLERYVAFTRRGAVIRRFAVEHERWPQVSVDVRSTELTLLMRSLPSGACPRLAGANVSPGVNDVVIGAPVRLPAVTPRSGTGRWIRGR
jgi:uncharacterized protein